MGSTINAVLEATRRTMRARTLRVKPKVVPIAVTDPLQIICKTPVGGIAARNGSDLLVSATCPVWKAMCVAMAAKVKTRWIPK